MKRILIAATMLFTLTAQAEVNGGKLFDGIENGCSLSYDYQNYLNSICRYKTKKGLDYCEKGSVRMPIEYDIKSVKVENRGDHSLITTLFSNDVRWHGVPVAGIESWHGHSNGIGGTALLFDTKQVPDAKAQLTAAGVKFTNRRDDVLDTVGVAWNKTKQLQRAVCDWSN